MIIHTGQEPCPDWGSCDPPSSIPISRWGASIRCWAACLSKGGWFLYSYLTGIEHIRLTLWTFEDDFPLSKVGHASSMEGIQVSITFSQILTESVGLLLVPKKETTECWSFPLLWWHVGDHWHMHQTNHRSRFLRNMHQPRISSLFGGGFKDVYFQNPA